MKEEKPIHPDYTASNHEEMAQMVLRKIKRTYQIEETDWAPDENEAAEIAYKISSYLSSPAWKKERDLQIGYSATNASIAPKLDLAARTIMIRYMDALYLRETLMKHPQIIHHPRERLDAEGNPKPKPLFQCVYDWPYARRDMAEAYISHLASIAQLQFKDISLNERSTRVLHGMIVRSALAIDQSMGPRTCKTIEPVTYDRNQTPEDRDKEICNYWRTRTDSLAGQSHTIKEMTAKAMKAQKPLTI